MHLVQANSWVALRLPSDTLKVLKLDLNTTISIGKYGTFPSNLVIGRPYNVTYEVIGKSTLRLVPAAELHADVIAEEAAGASANADETNIIGGDGVEFTLVGENGEVLVRSNRETIDDSARQTLSMEEIEALKRDGSNAGQSLITKLMLSHTALDEKTKFSLAKYKLTKTKKFLKRFTILPLDLPMLAEYLIEERDTNKIMEISQEMIALAGCWANVHFAEHPGSHEVTQGGSGRWLIVDETGGLLVAAMAERMGILYTDEPEEEAEEGTVESSEAEDIIPLGDSNTTKEEEPSEEDAIKPTNEPNSKEDSTEGGMIKPKKELDTKEESAKDSPQPTKAAPATLKHYQARNAPFVTSNTITLVHSNSQANLSLLKYFDYNHNSPSPNHPLTHRLHTLSWLQLLTPNFDPAYAQPPPPATPLELAAMKSGKRSAHHRKLRRHLRTKAIVDASRRGGFDGLIVASSMSPVSVLQHLVPLLRGGAPVVVYSPVIEPLVELADLYSISRKTAYITAHQNTRPRGDRTDEEEETAAVKADFPLNPTLLLSVNVQTSKVRHWQVLPGRTHPRMTGHGGGEGFLFTGIRAIPAVGKIEARGVWAKRKVGAYQDDGEGSDRDVGGKVESDLLTNGTKRKKGAI